MKNRIKECRISEGMSRAELGKLVGLSDKAIAHYENGIREPKLATLEKLAAVFGVNPAYLVGWIDHE